MTAQRVMGGSPDNPSTRSDALSGDAVVARSTNQVCRTESRMVEFTIEVLQDLEPGAHAQAGTAETELRTRRDALNPEPG